MTRFFGEVGYGTSVETPPGSGVWVDGMVEISYFGDVNKNTRRLQPNEDLLDNIVVNNTINIVADNYAYQHSYLIKYVRWDNVLWTVTSVEVQRPRLILSLGSVYNGPTA